MVEFEKDTSHSVVVYRNRDYPAAWLYTYDDKWVLDSIDSCDYLTSEELRQIADKLDELNGGIGVELLSKD